MTDLDDLKIDRDINKAALISDNWDYKKIYEFGFNNPDIYLSTAGIKKDNLYLRLLNFKDAYQGFSLDMFRFGKRMLLDGFSDLTSPFAWETNNEEIIFAKNPENGNAFEFEKKSKPYLKGDMILKPHEFSYFQVNWNKFDITTEKIEIENLIEIKEKDLVELKVNSNEFDNINEISDYSDDKHNEEDSKEKNDRKYDQSHNTDNIEIQIKDDLDYKNQIQNEKDLKENTSVFRNEVDVSNESVEEFDIFQHSKENSLHDMPNSGQDSIGEIQNKSEDIINALKSQFAQNEDKNNYTKIDFSNTPQDTNHTQEKLEKSIETSRDFNAHIVSFDVDDALGDGIKKMDSNDRIYSEISKEVGEEQEYLNSDEMINSKINDKNKPIIDETNEFINKVE